MWSMTLGSFVSSRTVFFFFFLMINGSHLYCILQIYLNMGLMFILLLLIGALCYNEHRQLSGSSEVTRQSHFYLIHLYQCVLKPRGNAVKCS